MRFLRMFAPASSVSCPFAKLDLWKFGVTPAFGAVSIQSMKLSLETVQEALGAEFQLIRELGGAGMSRVYQARDLRLRRDVVVKVLPPDLASTKSTARFQREIAVTTQLQHPNIIPILETGYVDRSPYYLSPYINGENLRQMIEREGAVSLEMMHTVISDICSALEFAHKSGIVHRDIKPANILISQGRAILADFGVARFGADNLLTQTDSIPGTLAYQAPERPNDSTCDLYALAVVAHEMFSGSRPNLQITVSRLCRKRHKRGKKVSLLREYATACVIAKALSINPKSRFPNAHALADAFMNPTSHAFSQLARRIVSPAALLIGAAALGLSAFSQYESGRAVLVADRYAIAPLRVGAGVSPESAGKISERFESVIGRWKDLQIERLDEGSPAVKDDIDLKAAFVRSRNIGASLLVTNELQVANDALKLRVTVWDVRARRALRTFAEAVEGDSAAIDRHLDQLSSAILRGNHARQPSGNNRSLHAWREFDAADSALLRWDLSGASRHYENALNADAQFGAAHLGLARSLYWQDSASNTLRSVQAAERASDLRATLDPAEQLESDALKQLIHQDFVGACKTYELLVRTSPNSFAGELGLGDCRSRDPVVALTHSRQFQFRSSFAEAALHYERALALQQGPKSEFVIRRLRKVLFTEANQLRSGVDADGTRYLAYMELVQDTVTFPTAVDARTQSAPPRTLSAAVHRNISRLEPIMVDWVKGDSTNANGHAMLADLMESAGIVTETGARDLSALGEIRKARKFSKDSVQRIYYARSELRFLLKSARFDIAREFADSVVSHVTDVPPDARDAFASLAALIGRSDVVKKQMELAASAPRQQVFDNGRPVKIPGPIARARAGVFASLLMGSCSNSIVDDISELQAMAQSNSDGADSKAFVAALLSAPMAAGAQCVGVRSFRSLDNSSDRAVQALHRLAIGRAEDIRPYLKNQQEVLRQFPRNIPIDQVLLDAWIMTATGDSSAAGKHLELALNSFVGIAPIAMSRPTQFAAFVRAHAFAANLAMQRGQVNAAKRHAGIVLSLWQRSDTDHSAMLTSMREIIRKGNA